MLAFWPRSHIRRTPSDAFRYEFAQSYGRVVQIFGTIKKWHPALSSASCVRLCILSLADVLQLRRAQLCRAFASFGAPLAILMSARQLSPMLLRTLKLAPISRKLAFVESSSRDAVLARMDLKERLPLGPA